MLSARVSIIMSGRGTGRTYSSNSYRAYRRTVLTVSLRVSEPEEGATHRSAMLSTMKTAPGLWMSIMGILSAPTRRRR